MPGNFIKVTNQHIAGTKGLPQMTHPSARTKLFFHRPEQNHFCPGQDKNHLGKNIFSWTKYFVYF